MNKGQSEEKGLLYVWDILHKLKSNQKTKSRAETWNVKEETKKKNIIENYQNKMLVVNPHISIITLNINGQRTQDQKAESSGMN